MKRGTPEIAMKSLLLGCLLIGCASAASAASNEIPYQPELRGQTVQCSAFQHAADGTWTSTESIPIQRQNEFTTVSAGSTFRAGGSKTVGIDIGAVLDATCPH